MSIDISRKYFLPLFLVFWRSICLVFFAHPFTFKISESLLQVCFRGVIFSFKYRSLSYLFCLTRGCVVIPGVPSLGRALGIYHIFSLLTFCDMSLLA